MLKIKKDYKKYGFHDNFDYIFESEKGLSEKTVKEISSMKGEPEWMTQFRLKALEIFKKKPLPMWGADLTRLNFDNITYYIKPTESSVKDWKELPENIKKTFDKLGVPEAERNFLAGSGAQFESEMVYHNIKKGLEEQGVIFSDFDTGLKEHEQIIKKYIGTVVPPSDNKFAALNSAVWSGGTFLYVPKGVEVKLPLQAYFRINAQRMGQFERTLIIAEEESFVHYIEGCTAAMYEDGSHSLHAAVVEVIAKAKSRVRYTTIQNWSNNVYNLVTKRAYAYRDATVEWIDGNLGSGVTMKYPAVWLLEPGARAEILSIAFAGKGQHQDNGAKVIHKAPNTSSTITSKSISRDGGRTSYRGLVRIKKGAKNSKSNVRCDALILDKKSASDTFPYMEIHEKEVSVGHEASVQKINEEQLFYLMSRGLSESESIGVIVRGFIEPFTKALPMEYAVEINRLIEMEMKGVVG